MFYLSLVFSARPPWGFMTYFGGGNETRDVVHCHYVFFSSWPWPGLTMHAAFLLRGMNYECLTMHPAFLLRGVNLLTEIY